ncbi:prepilin peptidase [Candidatus Berkelbacteria bacterium CG08_land_8_20_14_0_20_39_8]|uniref:Prepilin peptidase n=1 Tax=Candidatus Berkelbacteria bacterium CG08_land_8_20_14_0_20_39_8 TaxID=1974511 RepID=A0A2M6YCB0_9BACT|nr:MAG: prepilin peptidase [Candidatus Berkelbacteria bacterium CG08_land_8_20_14_0_20_39_8]
MAINIVFGIFGLFVGSFLNVIIFRFPELKGVVSGRSYCPKCKKTIAGYDLIPVVSYINLWGKCRNCRKQISWQYPLVELFVGVLFYLLAMVFEVNYLLIFYLLIAAISTLILVYDFKYLEIPEVFSWLLTIFTILAAILSPNLSLQNFLLGGLIGGGVLGILVGISNERIMGSGDIKIGLAFGVLLGFERSILFLFLAFFLGALFGIILILFNRRKLNSEVAFAPFLIISAMICLVWGEALVNLYLQFAMI